MNRFLQVQADGTSFRDYLCKANREADITLRSRNGQCTEYEILIYVFKIPGIFNNLYSISLEGKGLMIVV